MVHRIQRDSEHECVAFMTSSTGAVERGRGVRAPPACALSRSSCRSSTYSSATVDQRCPPAISTQATCGAAGRAARRGRHDRRRRQLALVGRQAPLWRSSLFHGTYWPQTGKTSARRPEAPCVMAAHDIRGRRRSIGRPGRNPRHTVGRNRGAVAGVGAYPGPTGAGLLREDGLQRRRERADDAGLQGEGFLAPSTPAEYELDNAKIAHLWMQGSVVLARVFRELFSPRALER